MKPLNSIICFLLLSVAGFSQPAPSASKVIVISGGGARGAWGGGVIEALINKGNDYSVAIGNSTGSLLAPLTLIDSIDRLKVSYITTQQKDIFSINPFKKNGKVRIGRTLKRVVLGKSSIGESKNLEKRIEKFFYERDYNQIRNEDRMIVVATVNLTKDSVEYKSSVNYNFPEMANWIWVSCNQPIFMTLYQTRFGRIRYSYVDGGIKESIPLELGIQIAKERGLREIDVVVNNTDDYLKDDWGDRSTILPLLFRTIEVLGNDVRQNDLSLLRHEGLTNPPADPSNYIQVNVYYMDLAAFKSCNNSLMFSESIMTSLWETGKRAGEKDPNLTVWIPIEEETNFSKPGKITLTLEEYPTILFPKTEETGEAGNDKIDFAVSLGDMESGEPLAGKKIALEIIQGDTMLQQFFNLPPGKNFIETSVEGTAKFTFDVSAYADATHRSGAFRLKFIYLENPIISAETKSIEYFNGKLKKVIAEAWERKGFEAVLSRDIEAAISSFQQADSVSAGIHDARDISIYLQGKRDQLLNRQDNGAWAEVFNHILENFNTKMQSDIKDRMRQQA